MCPWWSMIHGITESDEESDLSHCSRCIVTLWRILDESWKSVWSSSMWLKWLSKSVMSDGPTMTSMTSMTPCRSKCKSGWPAKLPIPFQSLGLGHVCVALFFLFGTASEVKNGPSECQECQKSPGTSESPRESPESQESLVALRLFSPIRSTSPEALKAEVIAAEAALALRAEVDGLPVVYDSPGVSISLRKVSPDVLVTQGAILEAPDGGGVTIPADPRVRGRHGGPVTVSVTSYHAGDALKTKEMQKINFGSTASRKEVGPTSNTSNTSTGNGMNGTTYTSQIGNASGVDRVDFFMTKTSVSWRGTVNVKVPGLSAQVPAKDRPWTPLGEDALYAEEKAEVKAELERLASLKNANEKLRGYRKLARQWHPDKHPEEREKATEVFEYLQELRLALGLSHSQHSPQSSDSNSEIHSYSESWACNNFWPCPSCSPKPANQNLLKIISQERIQLDWTGWVKEDWGNFMGNRAITSYRMAWHDATLKRCFAWQLHTWCDVARIKMSSNMSTNIESFWTATPLEVKVAKVAKVAALFRFSFHEELQGD